jgi:hypothetical protein
MIGVATFILLATWIIGVASAIAAKPVFMAKVGLVISTPVVILIAVTYLLAWLEIGGLSLHG